MRSVHIVIGSTGEYDDHNEWSVAAFSTKARAETFCARANDWLKARGFHYENEASRANYYSRDHTNIKNPYDDNFHFDYTGAKYSIAQVFLDPPLPTKSQGA